MLNIKNLSYAYNKKNDQDAIHDISLLLPDNQIGILLGPNGAGKSTLLKCITGVHKIREDQILIQEEDLSTIKERDRAKLISYVPQTIQLASLTVYDAILMGRIPYIGWHSTSQDKEITLNVIKEMGLENLAMKNVSDLSGGERQKVVIARALAQEAKILLFDEPTSALDITSSLKSLSLIKKIVKDKHLSALISLHDINLALSIGDIFYFIKDGRLIHQGGMEIITPEIIKEVYDLDVNIEIINDRKHIIYKEI
jgi:iron complex transport system ATP-binding protein